MSASSIRVLLKSSSRLVIAASTLTAAAGVLLSQPVMAATPDVAAADAGNTVETVVVTAQRRTESLQSVPISAQVVTSQTIAASNSNSLASLSQTTPAVHVNSGGRSNDLFVRGVGSGENQSFDQGVGTFIDDVYFGRSRSSAATFLDLDHVEFLKGPQSTFFGNNAIAGALNLLTKQPTRHFEGDFRALYGQFGQYAVEAAAGGPINDVLSARAAVIVNGDSGYLDNINLGKRVPIDGNSSARLTLKYQPIEDFDVTLKAEAARSRNVGASNTFGQVGHCPPASPFPAAGFCKQIIAQNLPSGTDNNLTALPGGQGYRLDADDFALTAHYRHWGQTFTSVTAFQGSHFVLNEAANETINNGPPTFSLHAPERYHQFSQEFRVQSPSGQKIEYLAGVYFQSDQVNFAQDLNLGFLAPSLPAPFAPLSEETNFSQKEEAYSAFAALTWNVTDRLKLSAGLRATRDHKSYGYNELYGNYTQDYGGMVPFSGTLCTPAAAATGNQLKATAFGLGAACSFSGSRTDQALQPSVRVQYQLTHSAMAYASYSRGFLAGGFNGADTSGNIANLPFAPEHVDAYEVGLKSQWFDNRVRLNLDYFRSEYTDLQVSSAIVQANGAPLSKVNNAGRALSQGVEAESEWVATDHLRLAANVTYLDAYYLAYPNGSLTTLGTFCNTPANLGNSACIAAYGGNGGPGPFQNLTGRPTPFAPTWSGSVSVTYATDLPDHFKLTAVVTPYFTTRYFLSSSGNDDPFLMQGGYTRLDARLTLDSPDRRWSIDVIGKNLTDQTILTWGLGQPASLGSFTYGKEMPRNVAVQLRYHW